LVDFKSTVAWPARVYPWRTRVAVPEQSDLFLFGISAALARFAPSRANYA
jgi:hypothetical protein